MRNLGNGVSSLKHIIVIVLIIILSHTRYRESNEMEFV